MIKLKSLIEIIQDTMDETNLLFEFPMRIGPMDMSMLDDHHKNFGYTKIIKEKSKLADKFEKYEVYRFNSKDTTNDITVAYFNYTIKNKDFYENKIWQDQLNMGLCRKILFEFYLKNFDRIISDGLHTELGEKYWKSPTALTPYRSRYE